MTLKMRNLSPVLSIYQTKRKKFENDCNAQYEFHIVRIFDEIENAIE